MFNCNCKAIGMGKEMELREKEREVIIEKGGGERKGTNDRYNHMNGSSFHNCYLISIKYCYLISLYILKN